jgi:hypothetical protein
LDNFLCLFGCDSSRLKRGFNVSQDLLNSGSSSTGGRITHGTGGRITHGTGSSHRVRLSHLFLLLFIILGQMISCQASGSKTATGEKSLQDIWVFEG